MWSRTKPGVDQSKPCTQTDTDLVKDGVQPLVHQSEEDRLQVLVQVQDLVLELRGAHEHEHAHSRTQCRHGCARSQDPALSRASPGPGPGLGLGLHLTLWLQNWVRIQQNPTKSDRSGSQLHAPASLSVSFPNLMSPKCVLQPCLRWVQTFTTRKKYSNFLKAPEHGTKMKSFQRFFFVFFFADFKFLNNFIL